MNILSITFQFHSQEYRHEIEGVRKEKERLTAVQQAFDLLTAEVNQLGTGNYRLLVVFQQLPDDKLPVTGNDMLTPRQLSRDWLTSRFPGSSCLCQCP